MVKVDKATQTDFRVEKQEEGLLLVSKLDETGHFQPDSFLIDLPVYSKETGPSQEEVTEIAKALNAYMETVFGEDVDEILEYVAESRGWSLVPKKGKLSIPQIYNLMIEGELSLEELCSFDEYLRYYTDVESIFPLGLREKITDYTRSIELPETTSQVDLPASKSTDIIHDLCDDLCHKI